MRKLDTALLTALVACGGSTGGRPGGSPAGGGSPTYAVTDLGFGHANFIDAQGRISGTSCSTAAGPCGGAVYLQGSGWSLAPVPQDATVVDVMGTDSGGNMALNVHYLGSLRGGYWLAYTSSPLERIPIPATVSSDGNREADVKAMNSAGHVVGPFQDGSTAGSYFFDGSLTRIGEVAQEAGALAINSRDQVAGWFLHPDDGVWTSHAFLWERGVLRDLGTLAGSLTEATAINDSGIVAGWGMTNAISGTTAVFRWDGQMHALGCPPGTVSCQAFAINARGDIVGDAIVSVGGDRIAFIWRDGAFHRLDDLAQNASSWRFERALSINDAGQVVGTGLLNGAANRAYLLAPR